MEELIFSLINLKYLMLLYKNEVHTYNSKRNLNHIISYELYKIWFKRPNGHGSIGPLLTLQNLQIYNQ